MKAALILPVLVLLSVPAFAQSTAFTYQGRLNAGGAPASGNYDLTFTLFDDGTNGIALGGTLTNSLAITNGYFVATLDFGNVFPGADRWLELRTRTNGTIPFTVLSPRQRLTSVPYALTAAAVTGPVAAAQLSGTLPAGIFAGTYSGAVSFTNGANNFSGNGGGLTNVSLAALAPSGIFAFTTNITDGLPAGALFTFTTNMAVGYYPNWIAAADLNNDGRVDLVTANILGNNLTVLFHNANDTFTAVQTIPTDSSPYSVAVADLNGDGKPDLVCANQNSSTVQIFTNNGSGVFSQYADRGVSQSPNVVVVADLNGDGKPDLVIASGGNNVLDVLTNDGTASFPAAVSIGVGVVPNSILAADFNGDGKIDLICGNSQGSSISVLTNAGNASFVTAGGYSGISPYGLAAADVNNDGKMDFFCNNRSGPNLLAFINSGNAVFTPTVVGAVTNSPLSLVAADINGDGKMDAICTTYKNGLPFPPPGTPGVASIYVFLNAGNGNFTLGNVIAAGTGQPFVVATNLNADSILDIAYSDNVSNSVILYTNRLSGSTPAMTNISVAISNLNAANLVGTVPASALPANIAYVSITNGLATTGYVNAATASLASQAYVNTVASGLATPAVTNGLATTNYVAANYLLRQGGTAANLTVTSGSLTGNGGGLTNLPTQNNYAFAYNLNGTTLGGTFSYIGFEHSLLDGWLHQNSLSSGDFYCLQNGIYEVTYTLTIRTLSSTVVTARLVNNNVELPGSEIVQQFSSTVAAQDQNLSTVTVTKTYIGAFSANDDIVLQCAATNTGTNPVHLDGSLGQSASKPAASLSIIRLK